MSYYVQKSCIWQLFCFIGIKLKVLKNLILFFLFSSFSIFAQQNNRIKVAVLGTFHFGESNDLFQTNNSNLLTKKKQKEIDELVNQLTKFNPDKIFVENTPDAQKFWDGIYIDYKNGKMPKDPSVELNEIFQIGIKLADKLKNPQGVLCVNYFHPVAYSIGLNNAKTKLDSLYTLYDHEIQNRKPEILYFLDQNPLAKSFLNSYLLKNEEWKSLSLKKNLFEMNKPENLDIIHYLNVTLWLDQDPNGIGAELTTREYYRNVKIVQNVLHQLNPYDKKVLILIGAAHVKSLQDILRAHPLLEVITSEEFLK